MEVICNANKSGGCGFRVHDRYFETKVRFSRTSCPRCSGPIRVVEVGSYTDVTDMALNPVTGRVE